MVKSIDSLVHSSEPFRKSGIPNDKALVLEVRPGRGTVGEVEAPDADMPSGQIRPRRRGRSGRGVRWRYALRANTAASDDVAVSAWAPALAPAARPAEAYAGPLRLGVKRERVVRAGGGQGGAPSGRAFLTPRMHVRHDDPSLGLYFAHGRFDAPEQAQAAQLAQNLAPNEAARAAGAKIRQESRMCEMQG